MGERDAATDMIEEMKRRWPWLLVAHFADGRQLILPATSEKEAARLLLSDRLKFDSRTRMVFEIVPSRWQEKVSDAPISVPPYP